MNQAALCRFLTLDLPTGCDDVHLWTASLDLAPDRIRELERFLSADERARANRFRFEGDRRSFIAARGSLRLILGDYLHLPPGQILFSYTPDNKPYLTDETVLHFNLSHSESLALIAVAQRRKIGVDVEWLRADFDPEALAKRFFSPLEYTVVCNAPPGERHRVFLTYWTCKEAYLKALGTGLRSSLKEFTVFLPDRTCRVNGANGLEITPYRLIPLTPAPEYVAALAVEVF